MASEGPTIVAIENWDTYQHYKNRSPPWIKLYNSLLDDPDMMRLQVASRWLAICLMLLASRNENRIVVDHEFFQWRFRLPEPPDLRPLQEIGFIRVVQGDSTMLAPGYQDARAEREGEGEREGENSEQILGDESPESDRTNEIAKMNGFPPLGKLERTSGNNRVYPDEFEACWSLYPERTGGNPKGGAYKAWRARVKQGADPDDLLVGTERYARYCRATDKEATEYVQQAKTFYGPTEPFAEPWEIPDDADPNRRLMKKRAEMEGWVERRRREREARE